MTTHCRTTGIKNKSRKFSQLPPASAESPLAVKMGSKFTMIPTDVRRESIREEEEESNSSNAVPNQSASTPYPPHKLLAKMISDEIKEKKNKLFSHLPPESPEMVPKITMVPADTRRESIKERDESEVPPEATTPPADSPHLLIAKLMTDEIKERSRRFSQLPPADAESPQAVKMGSKFTMIPTGTHR